MSAHSVTHLLQAPPLDGLLPGVLAPVPDLATAAAVQVPVPAPAEVPVPAPLDVPGLAPVPAPEPVLATDLTPAAAPTPLEGTAEALLVPAPAPELALLVPAPAPELALLVPAPAPELAVLVPAPAPDLLAAPVPAPAPETALESPVAAPVPATTPEPGQETPLPSPVPTPGPAGLEPAGGAAQPIKMSLSLTGPAVDRLSDSNRSAIAASVASVAGLGVGPLYWPFWIIAYLFTFPHLSSHLSFAHLSLPTFLLHCRIRSDPVIPSYLSIVKLFISVVLVSYGSDYAPLPPASLKFDPVLCFPAGFYSVRWNFSFVRHIPARFCFVR
jgi:hypothetical protein